MKPFQLILTAGFAIFAIVGLLVFAGANPSNNKNTIGEVVIWGTLPKEEVRAALGNVRDRRDDFDRVSYVEVDQSDFYDSYIQALAADRGPDMVLVPHELLGSISETLAPISFETYPARTFDDTFVDVADVVITQNGYLGIPVGVDPLVMFYNKTHLNSARVSQAPAFWEQFVGLVPRFVETTGSFSINKSFVALGAYSNIRHAEKVLASFLFQVGSPIRDTRGQIELIGGDSEDTESALRFYTEFANPNTSAYSWNKSLEEDQKAFLLGDLTLYFAPASEGKVLSGLNPNLSFAAAPFPQLEGGVPVVYGSVYVFAVPKAARSVSGSQTAAFAFINQNNAYAFSSASNIAPVLRTLLSNRQADPVLDLAYNEAFIAKAWLSPQPEQVGEIFSAMVDDVVSGREDAIGALTKAQRLLRQL
ncbi:MAG: extracellular solute-binding protein [Patescibacteria group bacterium UBA2103]